MSCIRESKRTWLEKFCINILKAGYIPKHVALLTDGSRRYGAKNNRTRFEGYAATFDKLFDALGWFLDLGIAEITMYCFSTENFKRPKEDVEFIFNMTTEKFREMLQQKDKFDKYGLCVRVFGDITLLPVDLQKLIAGVVLESYQNTKRYLNICIAYTSREEIASAVKDIASAVVNGDLQECDINEDILSQSLLSCKSTDPDIIIRTSGVVRLSDFFLWKSGYSVLLFPTVLFPDFSIWVLFYAILYYQRNCEKLKEIKKEHNVSSLLQEKELDIAAALQLLEHQSDKSTDHVSEITKIREEMNRRRKNYLADLDNKRFSTLVRIKEGNTFQAKPSLRYIENIQ